MRIVVHIKVILFFFNEISIYLLFGDMTPDKNNYKETCLL